MLVSSLNTHSQIIYKSPLGFSLSFDKTWKRLPKEVLMERMKIVQKNSEYKKDILFDACYQKIGNTDMEYPYILLKNVYMTTNSEDEIRAVQEHFSNKATVERAIASVVNGKFSTELTIGRSYYDSKNKILFFTYDVSVSVKGDIVGMFALYIGNNACLNIYCYSYKDEFKYDQKEFLDIIYSIKDNGMVNTIPEYTLKHDLAVKYFNEGRILSDTGDIEHAIISYTKAIENYPIEDIYMKSEAYYNRGLNKRRINNNKGAISDYTEAIRLRPDYYKAYNNRGFTKIQIEDYVGAIFDFDQVIKFDNYNTEFTNMALGNRGIAKIAIGQNGCPDLKRAIELGNQVVIGTYHKICK